MRGTRVWSKVWSKRRVGFREGDGYPGAGRLAPNRIGASPPSLRNQRLRCRCLRLGAGRASRFNPAARSASAARRAARSARLLFPRRASSPEESRDQGASPCRRRWSAPRSNGWRETPAEARPASPASRRARAACRRRSRRAWKRSSRARRAGMAPSGRRADRCAFASRSGCCRQPKRLASEAIEHVHS